MKKETIRVVVRKRKHNDCEEKINSVIVSCIGVEKILRL
jgi:hypothetical protein